MYQIEQDGTQDTGVDCQGLTVSKCCPDKALASQLEESIYRYYHQVKSCIRMQKVDDKLLNTIEMELPNERNDAVDLSIFTFIILCIGIIYLFIKFNHDQK